MADPKWKPRGEHTILNHDVPRVDGPLKATGVAKYSDDIRLPEMVWARVLIHPYPRLFVNEVDVEPARAVPGVVYAVSRKEPGTEVRFQGSDGVLAIVAAETPEAAEDALHAIRYDVEELYPPIVTVEQALDPENPGVGRKPRGSEERDRESQPNEGGDRAAAEKALEDCDAVVEARYELPIQHHLCLETHGVVVDYRGGDTATIYASTQSVSGSNRGAARTLELEAANVEVVVENMGGGFGSKFGLGFEGTLACEVAKVLGRPVHLMLKRTDEFMMAGNRSGSIQDMKGGATVDGKFVALINEATKLGGVGGGALPGGRPYIYKADQHFVSVRSVYTATDSSRAMRAPGHPQASFAIESMIDELAYAVDVDPLDFRMMNLEDEVYHRQLDRVAREIGWYEHPNRTKPGDADGEVRTGIGFGVSTWGGGGRGGGVCEVRISSDGSIIASTGTQDLGTGSRSLVAAIVAEEFGLAVTDVIANIGKSSLPPSAGSGGSVTTGSLTPTVKVAAHNAREALNEKLADVMNAKADDLVWKAGRVSGPGAAALTLDWKGACAVLGNEPLVVTGQWNQNLAGRGVHGAQAAKVTVDTTTGEVKVVKMVCIQDQGLPFNRLTLRSQINGGMIQALSYGMLEERVHDPDLGIMLTNHMESYKIAGCQEIGEIVSIIDDEDERQVAIGMAEATCIPGHGAIANAIYNACGVRIRSTPLTADKVLMAIAERS